MMVARMQVFAVVLMALLLATVNAGMAQSGQTPAPGQAQPKRAPWKKTIPLDEVLKNLKPGNWVQLNGLVQEDSSIKCIQASIYTGDYPGDGWGFTGIVRKIDAAKQELELWRMPIKIQKDAEFARNHTYSNAGPFESFADLKVGMLVQAEGTYLQDGSFLAKGVVDKSEKLADGPDIAREIVALGKVEQFDPAKRTVRLMGITFQLTDDTRGRAFMVMK